MISAVAALAFMGRFTRPGDATIGQHLAVPNLKPQRNKPAKARAKRRRNRGFIYPHSSTRQRARYARQIAAGQLNMAGVP
jgi:hypothetical protein